MILAINRGRGIVLFIDAPYQSDAYIHPAFLMSLKLEANLIINTANQRVLS